MLFFLICIYRSCWSFCNTMWLLTPAGLTDGSDVTQTLLLWKNEGQSATMNCSHTKDATYYQMYWNQQLPGEGMRQIVLTTTSPPHKYESGFSEDRFPAEKKDAQTGSLTVKKLQPQDSGVYFCAVSEHSDAGDLKSCTKTQLLVSQWTKDITVFQFLKGGAHVYFWTYIFWYISNTMYF